MVSTRSVILGALAFATTTLALPTAEVSRECAYTITEEQLVKIDSKTASCNATAAFADECAPASRAAPALTDAFKKYDISEKGVQAALIAIQLFESGSFAFNHNHFPEPGRPGQGTRNMQMSEFNEKYATELFGADRVAAVKKNATTGQDPKDAVLALVQGDGESFASAAWFLKSECDEEIEKGLAKGDSAGWDAYLTKCVGTTHTEDRDVAWTAAKKVLGA